MKADYIHKDTLTATDYVELNKSNELLMSYNQALLKENQKLKAELQLYQGALKRENEAIHRVNDLEEIIDKAINNSQYWIDYYTRLNSDERIALRLQENIDILKEVE